ncbi:MAG TPA: methyltransferase domain-containing protein, partial [Puia sp.]
GIGLQTQSMAKLVGDDGKAVGTDISNMMVEIARSRTASFGLPLEFLIADAVAQPFPDHSFDCIRIERVLMYIKDTQAVLREFKRLLRPGGRVVAFDFDWDAMVIAHKDKALTRRIVRYASDSFPNGRVGGELFQHMRSVGFNNIRVKPFSYSGNGLILLDITKRIYEGVLQTGVSDNVFSESEIADWWKALEEDAEEGNLLLSYQGFIVAGRVDAADTRKPPDTPKPPGAPDLPPGPSKQPPGPFKQPPAPSKPFPVPPGHPESPAVKPEIDPDIPEKPGPPLSDPDAPHG